MNTVINGSRAKLFHLLRTTPMRDVVRGQLSGRLDVPGRLAAAGLPAPIATHVQEVVAATRLWRLEKADVAAELTTHFLDGLETGRTSESLIEASGDVRTVAKLISRAKRRQRPLAWRAIKWIGLAIVMITLVVAGYAAFMLLGTPAPSKDYLAVVNAAPTRVAQSDRAWLGYRAAALAIEDIPHPVDETTSTRRNLSWDEVVVWLEDQQDGLALARDAAKRPALGFVYGRDDKDPELWPAWSASPSSALYEVTLPYIGELGEMHRLLAMDTRAAAERGDSARCVENLSALVSMAAHVSEGPFVVQQLVGYAWVRRAVDTAGYVLTQHGEAFDTAQLVAIAHILDTADAALGEFRSDGERMAFEDFIQRAYTDDGNGDGRLTLDGVRLLQSFAVSERDDRGIEGWNEFVATPGLGLLAASRREVMDTYNAIMSRHERESRLPLWESDGSSARDAVEAIASDPRGRLRFLPLVRMAVSSDRSNVARAQAVTRRDALQAAIALEIYHRRHGAYPADPMAVVPELLPAWPRDCFDGAPLRVTLGENGPVIYSIGTDRDDDGGVSPMSEDRHWSSSDWITSSRLAEMDGKNVPDGDWVLWPQEELPRDLRF